jgi:hypothetical protein
MTDMSKRNIILTILTLLIIFFCFCNKDDETEVETPLNFISLTVNRDTIFIGETVDLVAEAQGEELIYIWIAEKGNFSCEGPEVTYTPSPCTIGDVELKCKIIDKANNSDEKSIFIFVI